MVSLSEYNCSIALEDMVQCHPDAAVWWLLFFFVFFFAVDVAAATAGTAAVAGRECLSVQGSILSEASLEEDHPTAVLDPSIQVAPVSSFGAWRRLALVASLPREDREAGVMRASQT